MREIKFRAWDKIDKKWVNDFSVLPDGKVSTYGIYHPVFITQFTGLHDKHGKEIYEGDVVFRVDEVWTENEKSFAVVKYRYDKFEAVLISGAAWSFYCPDGETFSWDEVEVIGNIYENPELLGGTQKAPENEGQKNCK